MQTACITDGLYKVTYVYYYFEVRIYISVRSLKDGLYGSHICEDGLYYILRVCIKSHMCTLLSRFLSGFVSYHLHF